MVRSSKTRADRVAEAYAAHEAAFVQAGFEFTTQTDGLYFHKTPPDSDVLRGFFASADGVKKKGVWIVPGDQSEQKMIIGRLSWSLKYFTGEADPDVLRRRVVQKALIGRMVILVGERWRVLTDAGFYLQFGKNSVILPPNFYMAPYRECLRQLKAGWVPGDMRWFVRTPTDADREMVVDALIPLAPLFAAETEKQKRFAIAKHECQRLAILLGKQGDLTPSEWIAFNEARADLREVDDGRLLIPAHALPKTGELVRIEDRVRRVKRVGRCFAINIQQAHIVGSYLQPYVGEDGAYVYFDEGVVEPAPTQAVVELLKSRNS